MSYKFFSEAFAQAILAAEKKVKFGGFAHLTTPDVLIEVAKKTDVQEVFAKFSVDLDLLSGVLEHPMVSVSDNPGGASTGPFEALYDRQKGIYIGPSKVLKEIIILMLKEAADRSVEEKAGVLDFLVSLAKSKPKWFVGAITLLGVEISDVLAKLSTSKKTKKGTPGTPPELSAALADIGLSDAEKEVTTPEATPALDVFCQDLTRAATEGKIGKIIGRDDEIRRLISILNRKTKNNPCLVGDPGVGKTAVVEGLASRIVAGKVPKAMLGKRILSLDVASLIAGAKYGDFEARMKAVLYEAGKSENDVILFIDEIHTIIGAGDREGRLDAANMLKPSMGRGGIRVIGATTSDEYRKYIEKDQALDRRFQKVEVTEPKRDVALAMLRGICGGLEDHHNLAIGDDALEAAVDLSIRYLPTRFLPDKAIDLLDEACSSMSVGGDADLGKSAQLTALASEARMEMLAAIQSGDFEKAKNTKDRVSALRIELESIQGAARIPRNRRQVIGAAEIREMIKLSTGIPVEQSGSGRRLSVVEAALKTEVIGQGESATAVTDALRRSCAGVAGKNRPTGSFLFLGPTGVGKTETAKVLARTFYGDTKALLRFDMSEFYDHHTVSRLIGAPPGYVGNDDGGHLTSALRRNPYCVVLFDEIEKAHRDVLNILLQILENGELTDGRGKKADFRNAVIIMTSNTGAAALDAGARKIGFSTGEDEAAAGFEGAKTVALAELRKTFAPEFLNRIDSTIVFKPLTLGDLAEVAGLRLTELDARLKKSGSGLLWDHTAAESIAKFSFDPSMGARPVRRYVQDHIETRLASLIIDNGAGIFRVILTLGGVEVVRENPVVREKIKFGRRAEAKKKTLT